MNASVNWANSEKSVLHFEYGIGWTWEDVFEIVQKSMQKMDEIDYPVATIVDLTASPKLPPDPMNALGKIVENRAKHPNDSGITIFLNAAVLTKAMLDYIKLGDPEAAKFVEFIHAKTLNEALDKATELLKAQEE